MSSVLMVVEEEELGYLHSVVVVAQLLTSSSDNLLHCPEDWRREGIYCYRFFNIRHSWKRAAEICRSCCSSSSSISFN
ncbi:C-type lectin (CTL) or carbohydrate-recognition domain (CRD) [Tyrophagus putrescentiae]|nr:C-type lectin (CTL) or carbohydrate-recognition domain (CRD) [Tyrophagus putrescentiae]